MTDREMVNFLRNYCFSIGHTDGTRFDEATVTIHDVRSSSMNIISMKEIRELLEYYGKLSMMVDLGHIISPPEKFVYWMLKDIGLIDGYAALQDALSREETSLYMEH